MTTPASDPAARTRAGTTEQLRLDAARAGREPWLRFGPYLSERQWGTVREDYSAQGDVWESFTHEMARSRAYRWGEDGLAGFCDDQQRLCLGLALWNTHDPILKERLFGLTGHEGNHGEDVKELYYFLDATPTHAYQSMLYKYPQTRFPYEALVAGNRARGRDAPELELIDTGIFDEDRYFDVLVEYAKAAPEDVVMRIRVENRGAVAAPIVVLPQLWFRNTWSWGRTPERPLLRGIAPDQVAVEHPTLGTFAFHADAPDTIVFCENDTNVRRLYGRAVEGAYFKDGFHELVVAGKADAVNPRRVGTKAGVIFARTIASGERAEFQVRLSREPLRHPFHRTDRLFDDRRAESDAFYATRHPAHLGGDARQVQRQAWAGMLWSKQFYHIDMPQWLEGDPAQPRPPAERRMGRNHEWSHLNNADIMAMPDTWEYPWYAAWDLAFHCIPLAELDATFAKEQLLLLTREWYMHPNGQLPAYEWSFGDVNPPVHAWAALRVFEIDRRQRGDAGDLEFLERVLHKLLLNFTWWVNRKDRHGRNLFQGGFLGLDNIGVFDRSAPPPVGGHLEQADGTAWMAMYAANLLRIALELAQHRPVYEDIATKFFEHFLHIAAAMTNVGGDGIDLWHEADGFFYDVLHHERADHRDGASLALRIRSMVGLVPLFAVEVLPSTLLDRVPDFRARMQWFLAYRPDLAALISRWERPGEGSVHLMALVRGHRMKRLLQRVLDETEFLSDYGVRSLSRTHLEQPFILDLAGTRHTVRYRPGESDSGLFGGNSNWRGPVWFPMNYLLIDALRKYHAYYGREFRVECPTGSGQMLTLAEVADELTARLTRLFLPGPDGSRPSQRHHPKMARDPYFKEHLLFHEYFHGDDGRGMGASHQTGWTGLVATLLSEGHAAR